MADLSIIVLNSSFSAVAGTIQISVQNSDLETPSFALLGTDGSGVAATATFVRSSLTLFAGFTSYSVDIGATFIQLDVDQFQIDGVTNADCVIIHNPGQDPLNPDSQIATSEGCL